MNFHTKQGIMYDGAPELWGCPRMSKEAGEWVIDWYDADGSVQSVTRPDEAQGANDAPPGPDHLPPGALAGICLRCGSVKGKCFCA